MNEETEAALTRAAAQIEALQRQVADLHAAYGHSQQQFLEAAQDAKRLDWLAERLQDVQIDGADPTEHYAREDGEEEPWPDLWRRAIDAALAAQRVLGAA